MTETLKTVILEFALHFLQTKLHTIKHIYLGK